MAQIPPKPLSGDNVSYETFSALDGPNITENVLSMQDKMAKLRRHAEEVTERKVQEAVEKSQQLIITGPPRLSLVHNSKYVNDYEARVLWSSDYVTPLDPLNPRHLKYYLATTSYKVSKSFWDKVTLPPTTSLLADESSDLSEGCWNWTAATTRPPGNLPFFGFRIKVNDESKVYYSTGVSLAFALYTGLHPKRGLRQGCANSACVNPFHMTPNTYVQLPKPLKISAPGKKAQVTDKVVRKTRARPLKSQFDTRSRIGRARTQYFESLIEHPNFESLNTDIEVLREFVGKLEFDYLGRLQNTETGALVVNPLT